MTRDVQKMGLGKKNGGNLITKAEDALGRHSDAVFGSAAGN